LIRIPESHRDLLNADVGVLATVGSDGRPQLSAVWFLTEGDAIAVSLNTARQKIKNLKANAAATLFILDRQNPYRYLELRGDASIEPDDNFAFADRVGAKYQTNLREHDGPSDRRVKVEIHALRVNAVDMAG
jgi:PPOX class probable F420-dependent enzyme